ncbi:hypothetical protein DB30_04652 [Enhygromyxa salina]|uniref:V4R domain protein n=1 Tax=Enhygromyxa salina TaxID=215803 RepID=A0A0C2DHL6_9BACT|nr:hypothetical protein [Enhygromyxa salina]KIG19187.1 hypothetical protein DB30_04652 [Enhygromyxa salina]
MTEMTMDKQEYNGAALNSFILALGHSEAIINKLLSDAGVDQIDPERWYDFGWASALYFKIEAEVGRGAIMEVGKKMVETAEFPPNIDGIQTLLMSLDHAYRLNARGPNVGKISCTIDDDHSAMLEFSPKFPCALHIGIIEGSCSRYGARALIEHADGCIDNGDPACTYYVSW